MEITENENLKIIDELIGKLGIKEVLKLCALSFTDHANFEHNYVFDDKAKARRKTRLLNQWAESIEERN
jgi:hypothetical protein